MTYIRSKGSTSARFEVTFSGTIKTTSHSAGPGLHHDVAPAPSFGSSVPFQFYLENSGGLYGYGDEMNFVLQAPPGGRAYLTSCASSQRTWLYGSGSYYRGSMRAPYGLNSGYCPIEAVYIGLNGQYWYAPVPIFAHLRPRSYYNNGGYGNGGYGNGGYHGGRPHNRPTPRPTPNPWPPKPTPTPVAVSATVVTASTVVRQTPALPIAHPPHRPAERRCRSRATRHRSPCRPPHHSWCTPRPERTPRQPEATAAPTDSPTAAPAATPPPSTPEPPQPREPHTPPHPVQTPPV